MATVKGRVTENPCIEWAEDGSAVDVVVDLEDVEIKLNPLDGGRIELSLSLSRAKALFLWGKMDEQLVTELAMRQSGDGPTPMLDEVSRVLGVEDDDTGDH